MKFFVDARFTPGANPVPELEAEKRRVAELRDAGVIEQVLRRLDDTGAFLVVEALDSRAVDDALASLPFAASNTMTFSVDPIEPL
jgi:muconolactone delta-isomerase